MMKHGYIGEFEVVDDHRAGKIVVNLTGRLNKCGVISPRFDIALNDIEKWTTRRRGGSTWEERFLASSSENLKPENVFTKVEASWTTRRRGGSTWEERFLASSSENLKP